MRGLPREGETIKTEKGSGKVISINALKRSATVELEDGKFFEVIYNK
jgi:cell fate regulator YaaT (PSP1 superfamily)